MITNVLFSGVGGQGLVTASRVLAEACVLQDWHIKKSEIHGMSQRGGSVEVHLRFSREEEVFSPVISPGEAHFLLGFELLEALRSLPYLRPEGSLFLDPRRIIPVSVTWSGRPYPENALERLQASGRRLIVVPASEKAKALGDLRLANIILLGAAAFSLGVAVEALQEAIKRTLKPQLQALNLEALSAGVSLGAQCVASTS